MLALELLAAFGERLIDQLRREARGAGVQGIRDRQRHTQQQLADIIDVHQRPFGFVVLESKQRMPRALS